MTTDKKAPKVRDMTQGSIVNLILQFAVPLLIGNLFHHFYIIADTMVVGYHLGDHAIAAIGATGSLYSLLFFLCRALNNGYGIIVTQRFGAGDLPQMRKAIAGMILLDVSIPLLICGGVLAALPLILQFLNIPDSIFALSQLYTAIIVIGLVFTILYNMFASILMAMGNSRVSLYFLVLSSIINIVLDLLFVAVFHMGIAGAAIATVLAQLFSAIGCGWYTIHFFREYLPRKADFVVHRELMAELLSMGISLALMSCLIEVGSVIFQRSNNLLGETVITAYASSRKIMELMIQPQGCLCSAVATFVAQNHGARKYPRIRQGIKTVLYMEIGWGFFAMAVIYLFGAQLITLTTGSRDPEMISKAVLSLRIHFSMLPFLGVLFCMRNALQAMGQKVVPILSSVIELSMKILSAVFLIPTFGFLGACLTEPISWVLMASFLMIFYLGKRKVLFNS